MSGLSRFSQLISAEAGEIERRSRDTIENPAMLSLGAVWVGRPFSPGSKDGR
jgi:hypothetical protein